MIKNCQHCGREFSVKPSHYNLYFSCSSKCRWLKFKQDRSSGLVEPTKKICSVCKTEKPISEYFKQLDKHTAACKICLHERKKEWAKNNSEKVQSWSRKIYLRNKVNVIASAKEWNKNHPKERSRTMVFQNRKRKSRKLNQTGIDITAGHWKWLKNHFNNQCAYCFSDKQISMEHFIPLSKGGLHCISNIIPACKLCNSRKNNQDPETWVSKHFSTERLNLINTFLRSLDTSCSGIQR